MSVLFDDGSQARDPRPTWMTMPQAFSEEECAQIIGMAARLDEIDAGLVNGRAEASIRRTAVHWLPEDAETDWVYQRLARIVGDANRAFGFALTGFDEEAQIGRYQDGGFYDWHVDRGGRGTAGRRRKLTVSVQLTHPIAYDGGLLELNTDGKVIEAPRARGTAIVFPAYALHRVTPVTRGVRHSLVIWTHGPDFV